MSNYGDIAELVWENGQLSMHRLGGLQPTAPTQEKPILSRAHDTLESIVQHATYQHRYQPSKDHHAPICKNKSNNICAPAPPYGEVQAMASSSTRKRTWSNANNNMNKLEECGDILSGCCRDNNDTTTMTWRVSLESGRSLKNCKEEDSACHCGSEIRDNQNERDSKAEAGGQSNSKRRSRAAANHNQSERKRRDRINQKMKALQRLVPNANKADKASMLDEVIKYLKQLQGQIQMMNMTSMPQMMNMQQQQQQQQLQMSMLAARMGAAGLGMVNMAAAEAQTGPTSLIQPPATAPMFVSPASFMMPHSMMIQSPPQQPASSSFPMPHPYTALTQPINMDIMSNMAALYQQQMSQNNHQGLSSSIFQQHHEQGR